MEQTPTKPELELIAAVESGKTASFLTGNPKQDDPAHGKTWGAERTLRAQAIRDLCIGIGTQYRVSPLGIQISGARIVGTLDLERLDLRCPLVLRKCFVEELAKLDLLTTTVLDLCGSAFVGGFSANGIVAEKGVFITNGFKTEGEVRLISAKIGNDLNCGGAEFRHANCSLSVDRSVIGGNLDLSRTKAKGAVRLVGVQISGQLNCTDGKFESAKGNALIADGASVRRGVHLSGDFVARGGVSLLSAEIGGDLSCDHGMFENPHGNALAADGIAVAGSVHLTQGFKAQGQVKFIGGTIKGDLECQDCSIENPNGHTFWADQLVVKGQTILGQGFSSKGIVRMNDICVASVLDCRHGHFENPDGDAIWADRCDVRGGVLMSDGFTAKGGVRLRAAHIGVELRCSGTFDGPAEGVPSFDFRHGRLDGTLFWWPQRVRGTVTFNHAKIWQLDDRETGWQNLRELDLLAFEYSIFTRAGRPITAREGLEWIARAQPNSWQPQPYEQLSRVLRQMGFDKDAREVAFSKQVSRRKSGKISRPVRSWLWISEYTIGHGYKPWLILLYFFAFIGVGTAVFQYAYSSGVMQPTREGVYLQREYRSCLNCGRPAGDCLPREYPRFFSFIYSVDAFVPFVNLHQENYWLPQQVAYEAYLWFHIFFGWLVTSLGLVAVTGILKKD
jgi:sRNA-binding regulator protein Hfq